MANKRDGREYRRRRRRRKRRHGLDRKSHAGSDDKGHKETRVWKEALKGREQEEDEVRGRREGGKVREAEGGEEEREVKV